VGEDTMKTHHVMSNDQLDTLVAKTTEWAGSKMAAVVWLKQTKIPSLGDRTAMECCTDGDYELVIKYLDRIADGGYT
jgi:hypothetical protein